MSYFTQFNSILYPDFSRPGDATVILKNITSRVVRRESLIDDKSIFYIYTMKEDENIEDVSKKLYRSSQYYWVIMLINNRFDRFYDFPLATNMFQEYITEKYGSIITAINQKKYYIRPDVLMYSMDPRKDQAFWFEVPVTTYINSPVSEAGVSMRKEITMYDYELQLNESKRNILVIQDSRLSAFVQNFENLIR